MNDLIQNAGSSRQWKSNSHQLSQPLAQSVAKTAGGTADWISVREELTVHFVFQEFANTLTRNRSTRERLYLEMK